MIKKSDINYRVYHGKKCMVFLDCGGEYSGTNKVQQYQGVIRSPNNTENYESEQYCSWMLKLPAGHDIALNFTSFDLDRDILEIT